MGHLEKATKPHSSGQGDETGPAHLVIVDAANCVYRAFFAIPPLRTSDGLPTNAAYGFLNMLNKVRREVEPDHLVVVFDAPGKSFRHELFTDYKANRDAQPEDLSTQLPVIRELIDAYRVPVLEVPGFEADDVIATLVARAPSDWDVTIVSTDKDLMQLVSERVSLLDTMKDRRFDEAEVEARFGVHPKQVLDVRALVGDPSDNIPGVRGIGEKGAARLIDTWGDLETLLDHADEVSPTRAREALRTQTDQARLSKRLAELRNDVPLGLESGWSALAVSEPDPERLRELLTRLEFSRLLDELGAGPPPRAQAAAAIETERVEDERALGSLAERIAKGEQAVVVPVGAEAEPIAGLAFALDEAQAAYVPLQPVGGGAAAGLAPQPVLEALGPVWSAGAAPWGGRDVKRLQVWLGEHGLDPEAPRFDVEVAAFLIDPSAARATSSLAVKHLGRTLRSWDEIAGRGARRVAASELPLADVAHWAGEEVCALHALLGPLHARLEQDGLRSLYDEVEMPLSAVLARMERVGVRIDEAALHRLSEEYERELSRIEGEVHALAGESFTINSPKQLQRILFEKLKLPVVRKTKTGYSTDESVLEQLSAHHELPSRILAYRRLTKLKSTYVDALPPLVNPASGRIHPSFHQTGAATGRLSASNPNVQNIPIRTEEGIRIREAFIPAEGQTLLSADYSQVELRILAHFSEDPSLLEAFRAEEDIHRRTAATVLGVSPEEVSADQRARAKAVNFGIIYGLSAFGLANQLGIASADAQSTIQAYFERYQGVRRFLDRTVAEARERGYVRTLLGRRRYLPDLGSRNRVLRGAAERMAVNTVIQGTAADLIKRAMVEVDAELRERGHRARLILQVHDELVLEVPPSELEAIAGLVRERMEAVGPLRVPLKVDLGTGQNWREAH